MDQASVGKKVAGLDVSELPHSSMPICFPAAVDLAPGYYARKLFILNQNRVPGIDLTIDVALF